MFGMSLEGDVLISFRGELGSMITGALVNVIFIGSSKNIPRDGRKLRRIGHLLTIE